MTEFPEIHPAALQALFNGRHGDAFTILGPHAYDDGYIVRAYLPQAQAASLCLADGQTLPMQKTVQHGLYEAFVTTDMPPTYDLEITTHQGDCYQAGDPYSFAPMLSDFDEYLLAEGTHQRIYEHLGAQIMVVNGRSGTRFAVWAPNAEAVSLIGNFNNWDGRRNPMRFHHNSGIWELFMPDLGEGELYKYEIKTRYEGYVVAKSDPVGFYSELRPQTASIVWDTQKYEWQDDEWMQSRAAKNGPNAPITIYELHLGSWRRWGDAFLSYEALTNELIPYVKKMGYTHIELMPISEFPYDGSWGYQVTGYFAPTSRYGTPDQFMAFVDACHQANIGVILDWVPAHFPTDQHGLGFFDGTHLYEHEDPRRGAHPDWGTYIFNYGRNEVRQFLISNALFWLDRYHIDGLRVDAVASMVYLDFSREQGEWLPNQFGGRENIEAVHFIREFNDLVHKNFPDVATYAEESTAWPGVTRATADGGLGFDFKWNMGWMHDTLRYMKNEPIYRAYHQGSLTFSLLYAFDEQFVLPLSHDEVVHLKKSMLDKMPGDNWQKFANLRLLYGYQWAHPGKKLLFMGGEIGQWQEWSEARSLDWHLLEEETPFYDRHLGVQQFVADLNALYQQERALYEIDTSWEGFQWLDFRDSQRSLLAFIRWANNREDFIIAVCNFTPVVREGYRLGVPYEGSYQEVLNSDNGEYAGSHIINEGLFATEERAFQEMDYSIVITLPPLGITFIKKTAASV